MDAIRLIIEWGKKERQALYKNLAYQASEDYTDLKDDHVYRVQRVQDLLKENEELKKQLAIACHVDRENAEEFDWDILHRIWDLEDSLERVISVAHVHRNNPYDGIYAIIALAKRALKRSRNLK